MSAVRGDGVAGADGSDRTLWQRVASAGAGEDYAAVYADRFRRAAARGEDIHGEAHFVHALLPGPARVLDAGCGTGRLGTRLAELGHDVVGCDLDPAMIEVARRESPHLDWRVADLADAESLAALGRFDLVALAGNVVPFLEPGTLAAAARSIAMLLRPGGLAVVGYGHDADHVPAGCPVVDPDDVDAAFLAAGLTASAHHGTWAGDPWERAGGYRVSAWRQPVVPGLG